MGDRVMGILFVTAENGSEIAPEVTGPGLALSKCEAYDRPYDQHLGSH